jgi:hypothetical protein
MEVFDRSLTLIPIEMHTKYISNFHIKYSDQFVSSGYIVFINILDENVFQNPQIFGQPSDSLPSNLL